MLTVRNSVAMSRLDPFIATAPTAGSHPTAALGTFPDIGRADSPVDRANQDSAANLYHNVTYKPTNAAEIGLMMPPLGFLSQEAAGNIGQWVQALGTTPMPPYKRP